MKKKDRPRLVVMNLSTTRDHLSTGHIPGFSRNGHPFSLFQVDINGWFFGNGS